MRSDSSCFWRASSWSDSSVEGLELLQGPLFEVKMGRRRRLAASHRDLTFRVVYESSIHIQLDLLLFLVRLQFFP